jgi:hypothetical protein
VTLSQNPGLARPSPASRTRLLICWFDERAAVSAVASLAFGM